jgi:hypothetical protein
MRPRHSSTRGVSWSAAILLVALVTNVAWGGPPTVDVELVTEPGVSIEAPQKWIEMLKDMGFGSLRIRSGQRGDAAKIQNLGTDDRPHFAVTGIVTSSNVLRLPGANIRLGDKGALNNWVAKLQDGGEQGVIAKPVMYGLTAPQMVAVHDAVRSEISFDTKGLRSGEVLKKLVDGISIKVIVDTTATSIARSDEPVLDELQGLSHGTGLAAVLRPLGCVFVPEKPLGEELRLRVIDARSVETPWPVGWKSTEKAGKLAPDYFKVTNAEINDFVLADALEAIGPRIGLPLLIDHNSLARHKIEIGDVRVTSKKGRKSYASVLDEILFKARLKSEMRIDEAEKPFLWITTVSSK